MAVAIGQLMALINGRSYFRGVFLAPPMFTNSEHGPENKQGNFGHQDRASNKINGNCFCLNEEFLFVN
jgi:hypothetical protein